MNKRVQADLALGFCTLIWGATFVVVKEALRDASPFVFIGMRFALATALLAAIYRGALRKVNRTSLLAGARIGCLMFAGFACQTIGLQFTSPSKAAFITGLSVVLVPMLLAVFLRRRVRGWVWAGAVAALVGLYLLTVPSEGLSHLNRGDLWVLTCAVMFALHIIAVGRYSPHHSVGELTIVQVATTAAITGLLLPVSATAGWESVRLAWTGNFIFALLITAVGATAAAFSLQVWAQRHTTPAHTAILFSLEPVFAALTSFVVAHERLGPRAVAGAGLIFAGILLTEVAGPTQTGPESATSSPESAPPSY